MTTHIDILRVRKSLGRHWWSPPERFGPDGWRMLGDDGTSSIIITCAAHGDAEPIEYVHASIAREERLPSYPDLVQLHHAVWGTKGWAYQVFAPKADHVNIHPHALHLWGRLDGEPVLPVFGLELANGTRSI